MLTPKELGSARLETLRRLREAGIALTEAEEGSVEVADFGLGALGEVGLELITYVNTDRCCAKELVLFPWQVCPEHRHPPIGGEPGKEETFRCRKGVVYLYVEGPPVSPIKGRVPKGRESAFTVFHEVTLAEGEQYTLRPDTLHWFQGGPEGAIVSEFSTRSRDDSDVFTDPGIKRATEVSG
ncbi:MAG: D-lyxose/D-mannose family sugar isomerase [Oscillospiraceae bacterium]|nr:D-lyxose/D-mannose family sugar isomerase [Oscillospiraceae bacterium]